MKTKLEENLKKGRYVEKAASLSAASYVSKGGWTEHLLADRILFSHRENDYTKSSFSKRLHTHDHYELTLVSGGEGVEYIADGKSISVHRGMAILTKPGRFHMFRLSAPTRYDRYVLYFKNVESLFPDKALTAFADMGNDSAAIFDLPEGAALPKVKAAETALSETASPYAAAKAYLSLCDLFLTLSDHTALEEGSYATSVPPFMSEIKNYIDENFLRISSVEALAKQFFYSREYLSRSFKQYYNTPVYEYILGRRLLYCASLLARGETVERAARAAGFGNMSSFIKLFRKHRGCTPSEYRASTARK